MNLEDRIASTLRTQADTAPDPPPFTQIRLDASKAGRHRGRRPLVAAALLVGTALAGLLVATSGGLDAVRTTPGPVSTIAPRPQPVPAFISSDEAAGRANQVSAGCLMARAAPLKVSQAVIDLVADQVGGPVWILDAGRIPFCEGLSSTVVTFVLADGSQLDLTQQDESGHDSVVMASRADLAERARRTPDGGELFVEAHILGYRRADFLSLGAIHTIATFRPPKEFLGTEVEMPKWFESVIVAIGSRELLADLPD